MQQTFKTIGLSILLLFASAHKVEAANTIRHPSYYDSNPSLLSNTGSFQAVVGGGQRSLHTNPMEVINNLRQQNTNCQVGPNEQLNKLWNNKRFEASIVDIVEQTDTKVGNFDVQDILYAPFISNDNHNVANNASLSNVNDNFKHEKSVSSKSKTESNTHSNEKPVIYNGYESDNTDISESSSDSQRVDVQPNLDLPNNVNNQVKSDVRILNPINMNVSEDGRKEHENSTETKPQEVKPDGINIGQDANNDENIYNDTRTQALQAEFDALRFAIQQEIEQKNENKKLQHGNKSAQKLSMAPEWVAKVIGAVLVLLTTYSIYLFNHYRHSVYKKLLYISYVVGTT